MSREDAEGARVVRVLYYLYIRALQASNSNANSIRLIRPGDVAARTGKDTSLKERDVRFSSERESR